MLGKMTAMALGKLGRGLTQRILSDIPNGVLSGPSGSQIGQIVSDRVREYDYELIELSHEMQMAFQKRIREMEGTASDLKSAGALGKVVLFLRGVQRPLWGFSLLYLDFMVFSGKWELQPSLGGIAASVAGNLPSLESTFWMINMLVLGFLFGERALKNILPTIFQRR